MPTDFGIAGSRNYKADLASIDESKARSLLLAVKTQITGTNGTKSGVLKLVNLRGGGNITLERKGVMTRMFQRDGSDMRTTAETLKDLFAKADFSPEIRQELSDYLDRRANRAGTRTISALIDKGFTAIGAASGANAREALQKLGVELPGADPGPAMAGGRGKVLNATRLADARLYKINNKPIPLMLDGVNARGEPRLDRRKAAGSAYLENRVPGIVRPTIYVVAEMRDDGTPTYHAVAGDKNFRSWAANRLASNPASALLLTGTIMSRAKGVEMMNFNDKSKAPVVATVSPEALAGAAVDGLVTLKKMSAGGFVHGDLKSPNIFIDTGTRTLQFIDVDEISKMRKGQNGVRPPGFTSAYSHPNVMRGPVGFEQDLMGLGMSILHTALTNRGHTSEAGTLQKGLVEYNKAFKELVKAGNADASDPGFMKLRTLIESTVPADASPVEILALNWINAALDRAAPFCDRYGTERAEPHLLDRLDPKLNPEIARRIDRRTGAIAAQRVRGRQQPQAAPAKADPRQRQAPAAPQAPAVRTVQAVPPVWGGGLGAAVEGALDALSLAMDDALPSAAFMVVYPAVEAWTKTIEGMAMLAEAAAEARDPDALAARIREILTERINLEHLRFVMSTDENLKAIPADVRTALEGQINRRVSYEPPVLMNSERLATRLAQLRSQLNV